MKQAVVQKSGSVTVIDVPVPSPEAGDVLIATRFSLISAGTEAAARAGAGGALSLARKGMTDPAIRSKAMNRIRSHGLRATLDQVGLRAAKPAVVGYSASGVVTGVGDRITDIFIGQRVAAAGATFANHADAIVVPRALVTPIPDGTTDEDAAYTTLGAVALHAHRLSRLTIGERAGVIGLGVIGQLSCQLAAAAGCRVWGSDPSFSRCAKANELLPSDVFLADIGALIGAAMDGTAGIGVDVVILAAGSSDANLANRCIGMLRDRGRLVVIGSTKLNLDRDLLYRKEVQVVVSRSYGPGRYDDEYELRGADYPIGHVRWSEGRNLEAVLDLIARGRLDVGSLTTAVVPVDDAARGYELAASGHDHLGVLFSYGQEAKSRSAPLIIAPKPPVIEVPLRGHVGGGRSVSVALIGPGSFALSVLGPELLAADHVEIRAVVGHQSATTHAAAKRLRAALATTSVDEVLGRDDIDAVVIATRHDQHADQAEKALRAAKHVFLEKPMGLTLAECERVAAASREFDRVLMVDFNRRFSPHAHALRAALRQLSGSQTAVYRVNAGTVPADHWLRNAATGGGQVLGEAVHFIDLLCWLFDADPAEVVATPRAVTDPLNEAVATLVFAGGRSATLAYTTHGGSAGSKERLEVFAGGHTFLLDDYRRTERDGKTLLKGKQEKGHKKALANFVAAVQGHVDAGSTALDGLRATSLALQIQGRLAT